MKIAVLLSGGVDSAVALDLLYREGHELHPYYIRIGMDDGRGDCSAEEDIDICRLITKHYGLNLETVSLHEEYWDHVMRYTLETVRQGLTPHPDMMCNKLIKFGYFEERWGHEYDMTATGHYASTATDGGIKFLATAVDPVKDQTDFLAQISYSQLQHIMFPLGAIQKCDVRRIAAERGLPNAGRKDSQGICFLGKINYNDFLRRHLGERPGPVIDIATGHKIGTHRGYWFHTIGQRKGLGLGGGPWFVVRKNVHDNVLYVSHGYDTGLQYGRQIPIGEMHWISGNPLAGELPGLHSDGNSMPITFKTRHTPQFESGTIALHPDGNGLIINSDNDIQGIAPGQFAIIYTPDRRLCLGSGTITLDPRTSRRHSRMHATQPAPGILHAKNLNDIKL